jgi:hypothetical protein
MATALAVETYREALNTYLTDSTENTSADGHADAQAGSPHGHTEPDTAPTSMPHRSEPLQRTQLDRLRERLRDRTKQITALQGDVDPAAADELVRAARAICAAVTTDDEDAVDRAEAHLSNAAPSS